MGLIRNFPSHLLRPPDESYGSREIDEAHVLELIESFEEKDSMNRKGIRVVAVDKELWQTWSTASDEQREDLLVPDSVFMQALFACYLGCPTGDHTREAIQRLSESHPNRKKYKVLAKGLKVMVCAGTDEDLKMLLLLGNIDNEKRELHKKMDFPHKIQQMHNTWMRFDRQILQKGKVEAAARAAKTEQLKSWCGQWKMKYEQVCAFSQIGALMGKQWGLVWKIINGLYATAPRNKAGAPIKLQTNSQLNLLPGMEEAEANMLMQRVVDGELDRGDLRKECLKRMAYEEMRKSAIDIINSKTRSERDIKDKKFTVTTWDEVEAKFPIVAQRKFMEGWITAFIHKKKKAPAPVAFTAAITELLDNMLKKTVLTIQFVLVTSPLFMNGPFSN